MHHEQPGAIARRSRVEGDCGVRQLKVEKVGSHSLIREIWPKRQRLTPSLRPRNPNPPPKVKAEALAAICKQLQL